MKVGRWNLVIAKRELLQQYHHACIIRSIDCRIRRPIAPYSIVAGRRRGLAEHPSYCTGPLRAPMMPGCLRRPRPLKNRFFTRADSPWAVMPRCTQHQIERLAFHAPVKPVVPGAKPTQRRHVANARSSPKLCFPIEGFVQGDGEGYIQQPREERNIAITSSQRRSVTVATSSPGPASVSRGGHVTFRRNQ